MLIGDSLTENGAGAQGWGTTTQSVYARSIDVHNRGLSGYSTELFIKNGLPIISNELTNAIQPALITLWFGANDAALADGPSRSQHVPVDKYRENLRLILTRFRTLSPQSKILLISPPAVDDDTRRAIQVQGGGAGDPIDRSNEQARIYAAACGEVAKSVDGVTLLDMYQYMMSTYPNATDRAGLLADGLHFNDVGNGVVFEQVREQAKALLPGSLLNTRQIP